MNVIFAFHAHKAIVEKAGVQIPADDLLDRRMANSLLPFKIVPPKLGERIQNNPATHR